jgi:hypothetical protein
MLVAHLHDDQAGVAPGQAIPPDLGSRLGGLALGLVEVINRLATGKMNWLSLSGLLKVFTCFDPDFLGNEPSSSSVESASALAAVP